MSRKKQLISVSGDELGGGGKHALELGLRAHFRQCDELVGLLPMTVNSECD